MTRRCYPLLQLLCLTALWGFSSAELYKRILVGSECNTSSWTGVWMEKNGQFDCFRCDKGERWNRDKKLCEKCSGVLTSCEKNVFHGACSKKFCDDEGNATFTSQVLPTPTLTYHTVTNPTDNETTAVSATTTTGIPTLHMPERPNGTETGSKNGTNEQNKEDEINSHPEIPPAKDNSESEKSGRLAIGPVVGGIVFLLIIIIIIVVTIICVVKKNRSDPLSPPKSNAPEAQPGGLESTDTLLP